MIRLIVDARSTNVKCRSPPRVSWGTVAALSEVDLASNELEAVCGAEFSEEELRAMFPGIGSAAELPIVGSSLDVQDG